MRIIDGIEVKDCPAGCDPVRLELLEGELTGFAKFVGCGCGWYGPCADTNEGAAELWNKRVAQQIDLQA